MANFTAIDLFSGCGGLSVGLKLAGFRVVAAVEVARKAQETYRLNHPDVKLFSEDIRKIDPLGLIDAVGVKPGELDLLAGCPPCQGFSRLRTKNRAVSVEDPRNNLIFDFLRFISVIKPKCVMLENVPSLAGDARFSEVCEELKSLGYGYTTQVLDASDFEVPQRRRRLILLASRVHAPVLAGKSDRKVTVRDAFSELRDEYAGQDELHLIPERRTPQIRELISLIPKDGGSRRDLPDNYKLECHKRSDGFNDVYGRMAWDKVSPTITSGCHNPSKGRFLHPELDRTITLREAALLQGFPVDYKFDVAHGKEDIALMIGNALPPPFIKAHASSIFNGLVEFID
ncbi:putative BsuMI modification methylase subunit YdiO [compost metagenome]